MYVYCTCDEIFTIFESRKLLKLVVARDGIEPPTQAFSEPLTESPKWFVIMFRLTLFI